MKLTWLCWYVSGMFALLLAMTTFVTYGPGTERSAAVVQIVLAGGAIAGFVMGVFLNRLPREHWVHQSKPLWMACCAAAVVTVTILAVFAG